MKMQLEGPRQKQKRLTRERILAAALDVFRDAGFLAGKTEDIARAAGVAHGTVFVHFPTRDELLAAAVGAAAAGVAQDTRRSLRNAASVADVLHAHLEAVARDEDLFVHLARESFALPDRARAVVVEINSVVSTHLAEALPKRKGAAGRPLPPPAFLFSMWLGTLNHYLQNRDLFAPGGKVLKKRGAELVESFVSALNLA